MAKALIKYETIDADQIDSLMARQDVPVPKDWVELDDNNDVNGSGSTGSSEKEDKAAKKDGPIGGPAGQH